MRLSPSWLSFAHLWAIESVLYLLAMRAMILFFFFKSCPPASQDCKGGRTVQTIVFVVLFFFFFLLDVVRDDARILPSCISGLQERADCKIVGSQWASSQGATVAFCFAIRRRRCPRRLCLRPRRCCCGSCFFGSNMSAQRIRKN